MLIKCLRYVEESNEGTLKVNNSLTLGYENFDVDVYIDGTKQGTIEYDESKSFVVSEGEHSLDVILASYEEGAFYSGSGTFEIYDGATLIINVYDTGLSRLN
ncbi:MAG: hypothetical protein ACOC2M_01875 [bacterium]